MRYLATAIGLAAVIQLAGCSGKASELDTIASAKANLDKRDFKKAGVELKSLLQENPNSAEARFLFGKSLSELGEPGLAELELRKSLELKYPDAEVLPHLVRAMLRTGQFKRIIDDYATKPTSTPQFEAELKTLLAEAYLGLEKKTEARESLAAAQRAVAKFPAAMVLEARMSADAGDAAQAVLMLDAVTVAAPQNADAWRIRGDVLLYGIADKARAVASYEKAIALNPTDMLAHSALIAAHLSGNDLAAADAQLLILKKIHPNHIQVKFLEAQIAFGRKDYLVARELLTGLLRQAPANPMMLQLAGLNELELSAFGQAETYLGKVVQAYPNFMEGRLMLGRVYMRGGQPGKAASMLTPLLDRPDAAPAMLSMAAEAQLALGEPERAQALFERAAKLQPANLSLQLGRAKSMMAKGQSDLAIAEFGRIASADLNIDADVALLWSLAKQRDFAAAMRAADALERKRPKSAFVDHVRGELLLQQGNNNAARASFDRALAKDNNYFPSLAGLAALDQADQKPDSAQKRFEQVLQVNPRHVPALLGLANLRLINGANKDEVLKLLSTAKSSNPNDLLPRLALAENYLRFGSAKLALTEAQEAEGLMPNNPAVLDVLGRSQVLAGDVQQALVTFGKWSGLQPKAPLPNIRLAELHASRKDWDAAVTSYKRALSIAPASAAALSGLVRLYAASGRVDQALTLARQNQAKQPSQALAYALEGDVESSRRRWDLAASAYGQAATKPDARSELAEKLYLAQVSAGRPDAAEAAAEAWIKNHPGDALFMFNLGRIAMARQDLALAEKRFLETLRSQPANAPALNNVAWIRLQQGRNGAVEFAEKAVALAPTTPQMLDTLAAALAADGQFSKATSTQQQAVAKAGAGSAPYQLNLAKIYIKAGNKELAAAELDKLDALGNQFAGRAELLKLRSTLSR